MERDVDRALRDRAAIAGVGRTEFFAGSGVTTLTLACRAIAAALADAGLTVADVDGLATFSVADSVGPNVVAQALGLEDLPFYLHQAGGGSTCDAMVGTAAMACATGVAEVVVCYRALNGRSGYRMGSGRPPMADVETAFLAPYGVTPPPAQFVFVAQRHMARFGTTAAQLGAVAVTARSFAVDNDRAVMRTPVTLDDYLASPWVVEPFRLLDCCLETDGACAVVVTTPARAADGPQPPVLIGGAAWGPGHTALSNRWPDPTATGAGRMAPRLFAMAGLTPADVDVAELYDCFTYTVVTQLEDYGFCPLGDGGPYVEQVGIGPGSALPVNTHGGSLSEAYVHGLNHVAEAVDQLRGRAGTRQVPGAEVALTTGEAGTVSGYTSALLLHR